MESGSFLCEEMIDRSVNSSSGSDSDSDGSIGSRKRRSRSPESDSDVSDIFDVSEPRDEFGGILSDGLKLHRTGAGLTSLFHNLELQQLSVEDMHELPLIDDTMLDCLPAASSSVVEQPVVAVPVQKDAATSVSESKTTTPSNKLLSKQERNSLAQKKRRAKAVPVQKDAATSVSESKTTTPSNNLLSKRERNSLAQKKHRAKRRREEREQQETLVQLKQQVSTLQKEKNQMQSQLEQFRELFSKQNMSSMLMSSLCVICAVICVFSPCAVPNSDSQLGSQHFASPTGRSLLSVTASPPPPPQHDMTEMIGNTFSASGMSAVDLLLSCLSTVDQTAL